MPPRLPTTDDFPSSLHLDIIPPPSTSPQISNVLVLLHGLGDSHEPFSVLATSLALPHTCAISLRAPTPVPFSLGGYHWSPDIVFDQGNGQMEIDTGFAPTVARIVDQVLRQALLKKCGFKEREIILFGFGQGGMVALQVAKEMGGREMGGVVSVGGVLSAEVTTPDGQKAKTPVLICGGSSQSLVTKGGLSRLREVFVEITYHRWVREGDGMPRNREEMLPVMRFLARRLRSRAGVPEGSVELG